MEKYINRRELPAAFARLAFCVGLVYAVFMGYIGDFSSRLETMFAVQGFTIVIFAASLFIPERWEPGAWLMFALDIGMAMFGLSKFGGLGGWLALLMPLLAISAGHRFKPNAALAATIVAAGACLFAAGLPSVQENYFRAGMWSAVMLFFWSMMSQLTRSSHEEKYKMMYLDQEHLNGELVEKIKELEKKMQSQTIVDEATGLKNFRYFRSRIEEEILRAKRKGYTFSLALIEIDDMPEFVEAYGEQERRRAMHRIAAVLNDVFRNTDLIGIYKEHQFLVMMPETEAKSTVVPLIRFKNKLAGARFGPDNRFDLQLSIGVSAYPQDVQEVGGLLSLAAASLRRSQQKGRGMITLASSLFRKGGSGTVQ